MWRSSWWTSRPRLGLKVSPTQPAGGADPSLAHDTIGGAILSRRPARPASLWRLHLRQSRRRRLTFICLARCRDTVWARDVRSLDTHVGPRKTWALQILPIPFPRPPWLSLPLPLPPGSCGLRYSDFQFCWHLHGPLRRLSLICHMPGFSTNLPI